MPLTLTPLKAMPLIAAGDDLADIITSALAANDLRLQDGDILVLGQKIVSKAEGRTMNLAEVAPSARAVEIARETEKDARLIELILR